MNKDVLFENAQRVATAIATQFGSTCEVLVHDLQRPEDSIVYVAGNVTGRGVGGPVTDFVLSLLAQSKVPEDVVDYISRTRDGRTLKSSTVFLRDGRGNPIGALCINFDITALLAAERQLDDFVTSSTPLEVHKSFSTDVPDLLDGIIQDSLSRVIGSTDNVEGICKEERQALVADLDAQGVFRIQNSVPTVANILGVSRYTIYKDLNDVRAGTYSPPVYSRTRK